jgi:hypothetical protein
VKECLRGVFHPFPEVSKTDTSLRYTDILFGFVIRELFLRLQNWTGLDGSTRWHLVIGTVLVLGSWVGYRRSLKRSAYEVKFFNLPLLKFIADQLMLILYFRIAVMTPAVGTLVAGATPLPPDVLATQTTFLVVEVFLLYIIWDALGIWMAASKLSSGEPRYPVVRDQKKTPDPEPVEWSGPLITLGCLIAVTVVWAAAPYLNPWVPGLTLGVLLVYRFFKEIRTSWRSLATPA